MNDTRLKWLVPILVIAFAGCHSNKPESTTPADSLVTQFITLQDSVHLFWKSLNQSDSEKVVLMKRLASQLSGSDETSQDALASINTRIDNLANLRFTQQNLNDANRVEEYDFAMSSLINELAAQADTQNTYPQDTLVQRLVEALRNADDSTDSLRDQYDNVVAHYNSFLETNRDSLTAPNPPYPQFDSLPPDNN